MVLFQGQRLLRKRQLFFEQRRIKNRRFSSTCGRSRQIMLYNQKAADP
ncbi:MAG: hypothetical protein K0Q94_2705 [Paenibacillus sp.]|jgi:hypothetical protein|nr:hypothetical protein [Paenibacillus sp.]